MIFEKIAFISNKRKWIIILFLFAIVFAFRFHTLFNDYFDRDELGQMVNATYAIDKADMAFGVYGKSVNYVFNYVLKLGGSYNWRLLHLTAILYIFLTSIAVYFAVSILTDDKLSPSASAVFYALFMSIGFKDIYPLCAETIFNLYIAISFLAIAAAIFKYKNYALKALCLIAGVVFAYFAYVAKMHAKFYMLFFVFLPLALLKDEKQRKKGFWVLVFLLALIGLISFLAKGRIFREFNGYLLNAVTYITSEKLSIFFVLYRIFILIIVLTIIQFSIWYFGLKHLFSIGKLGFFSDVRKKYILLIFMISNSIPMFLTLRFFPHYTIQALLPLSMLAGIYFSKHVVAKDLLKTKLLKIIKLHLAVIMVIYLVLPYLVMGFKKLNPEYRTKLQMYLPNARLVNTINWMKKNIKQGSRIFVWGDAVEIYYYTKSKSAGLSLWVSVFANSYLEFRDDPAIRRANEAGYNGMIERIKLDVEYFIDTQPSGYSDFERFPLAKFEKLNNLIKNNFVKIKEIDKIVIYKRK